MYVLVCVCVSVDVIAIVVNYPAVLTDWQCIKMFLSHCRERIEKKMLSSKTISIIKCIYRLPWIYISMLNVTTQSYNFISIRPLPSKEPDSFFFFFFLFYFAFLFPYWMLPIFQIFNLLERYSSYSNDFATRSLSPPIIHSIVHNSNNKKKKNSQSTDKNEKR